jgi:hypothetical protein
MRLFFWRRPALADFAEAIRPELRAIATPEPSAQLLERILAARAAGVRVILPEPARHPRAKRALAGLPIAALGLLVVILVIRRAQRDTADLVPPSVFFAREAFAQQPSAAHRAGLPRLEMARPGAIRPLRLEFAHRRHDAAGQLTSESIDTFTVASVHTDGIPAWRVTSITREVVASTPRVQSETVYLARADLRLLRRAVHVTPYSRFNRINVEQRFPGDSIIGRMTTDGPSIGAGRTIARKLSPEFAPYLTDAFAPIALMATPLARGWQAQAALLGWAVRPNDVFMLMELRVEGEERVHVPAGTFDCWRLSIRLGRREMSFWARKSDGLGVRVVDSLPTERREIVLTRVTE